MPLVDVFFAEKLQKTIPIDEIAEKLQKSNMAKINYIIGKPTKGGVRKVSFILSHKGTRMTLPKSVYVTEKEVSRRVKITSLQKQKEIDDIVREYNDRLYALQLPLMGDMPCKTIYKRLTEENTDVADFFTFADMFISENKKYTYNFKVMLRSLERFVGIRKLSFTDIDYKFLSDYCRFLDGHPCAQSGYLGSIRRIYNEAVRIYNNQYEQPIPYSPFNTFKVPRQITATQDRFVSVNTLKQVFDYKGTGRAQLARDCYLLSFCLIGMNSVDLYGDDVQLRSGRICYHRAKTRGRREDKAYIEIDVPDIIRPIISRYKDSQRLFSFYKRYSDAAGFNKHLNIGLKKLAESIETEPFNFYSARHTWATIARNDLGIDKYTINEALNHVDPGLKIADIYIKKDYTQINIANRKVIEYVFKAF